MLDKGLTLKPELTAARLRELLHYDPETGLFKRRHGRRAGAIAGSRNPSHGYIIVRVDGREYRAHRLAWLYVNGCWPVEQVDHRDGDRQNNAFSNLRECNNAENSQNRRRRSDNASGFVGVTWDRQVCRWRSQIKKAGRNVCLGFFDDPARAHSAYLHAKASLHEFQRTPRPS